jgi:hypothetical protein
VRETADRETVAADPQRGAGGRLAAAGAPLPGRRRLAARVLLFVALALASRSAAAASAEYVIQISVDGLNASLLRGLIDGHESGDFANFRRLMHEGAYTFNARADASDYTTTIPNHTAMVTGRPTEQPAGQADTVQHGYTDDGTPGPDVTLHNSGNPHLAYVASVFDVVHDNGLSTALYASKAKFELFERSYDAENGAPDLIPPDDGTNKIDVYVNKVSFFHRDASKMQAAFLSRMAARPVNYAWVNYCDPDLAGHGHGWGSAAWNDAVRRVDGYLGGVFDLIANEPALAGKTAIILTADHGGRGKGHGDPKDPANFSVPFFVWGPGVEAGADLYALNAATRRDPGTEQPDYDAPLQPIRNGDSGNLALQLLGLGPIPGSIINAHQDLAVGASSVARGNPTVPSRHVEPSEPVSAGSTATPAR